MRKMSYNPRTKLFLPSHPMCSVFFAPRHVAYSSQGICNSDEGTHLECLYVCPESGSLFAAHHATIDIEPPQCVNAHIFSRPGCSSSLAILPAGQKPVARCPSCGWTTNENITPTVGDLVLGENRAFPQAEKAFESLQHSAKYCDPAHATSASSRETGLVGEALSSQDGGGNNAGHQAACPGQADSYASRKTRFPQLSPDMPAPAPEFKQDNPCREFPSLLNVEHVLSLSDRLVGACWDRRSMPPRRKTSNLRVLLRSPISGQVVATGSTIASLKDSPRNASQCMPHVQLRRHDTMSSAFVLSLRNETQYEMNFQLTILVQSRDADYAALCSPVSGEWENGKHCGVLPSGGTALEFVMLLEGIKSKPVAQIAMSVRLHPKMYIELGMQHQELECGLIMHIPPPLRKLPLLSKA